MKLNLHAVSVRAIFALTMLACTARGAESQLYAGCTAAVATVKEADGSRLLLKSIGKLKHEGEEATEVERTFALFVGTVGDAAETKFEPVENYSFRQGLVAPVPDPKYPVRAWRAVVTCLLRQHEFLYE